MRKKVMRVQAFVYVREKEGSLWVFSRMSKSERITLLIIIFRMIRVIHKCSLCERGFIIMVSYHTFIAERERERVSIRKMEKRVLCMYALDYPYWREFLFLMKFEKG